MKKGLRESEVLFSGEIRSFGTSEIAFGFAARKIQRNKCTSCVSGLMHFLKSTNGRLTEMRLLHILKTSNEKEMIIMSAAENKSIDYNLQYRRLHDHSKRQTKHRGNFCG